MKRNLKIANNISDLDLYFDIYHLKGHDNDLAYDKVVRCLESFPKLKKLSVKLSIKSWSPLPNHRDPSDDNLRTLVYPKIFGQIDDGLIEFDATFEANIDKHNEYYFSPKFECCWKAKPEPGKVLGWKPRDVKLKSTCGIPLIESHGSAGGGGSHSWHGKGCKIHDNDLVEYLFPGTSKTPEA